MVQDFIPTFLLLVVRMQNRYAVDFTLSLERIPLQRSHFFYKKILLRTKLSIEMEKFADEWGAEKILRVYDSKGMKGILVIDITTLG